MKGLRLCVPVFVALFSVFSPRPTHAAGLTEYVLEAKRVGLLPTPGVSGWAVACATDNPLIGLARRSVSPVQGSDGLYHIDLTMTPDSDPNHRFQYRLDIDLSASGSDFMLRKFNATLVDTAAVQPLVIPDLSARLSLHSSTVAQGIAMPRGSFSLVAAGGTPVTLLNCAVQRL